MYKKQMIQLISIKYHQGMRSLQLEINKCNGDDNKKSSNDINDSNSYIY